MILVIFQEKVIAVHADTDNIVLADYSGAEAIKKIDDSHRINLGDADPTILHPEWLLSAEYIDDLWPLEELRNKMLRECNQAVNVYIISKYDLGTQASFQAVYSTLLDAKTEGALSPDQQYTKGRLESVNVWIQAVLTTYYTVKASIQTAADVPALHAITWDFSGHDATDPGVHLAEFY